jgi:hypothetical protein
MTLQDVPVSTGTRTVILYYSTRTVQTVNEEEWGVRAQAGSEEHVLLHSSPNKVSIASHSSHSFQSKSRIIMGMVCIWVVSSRERKNDRINHQSCHADACLTRTLLISFSGFSLQYESRFRQLAAVSDYLSQAKRTRACCKNSNLLFFVSLSFCWRFAGEHGTLLYDTRLPFLYWQYKQVLIRTGTVGCWDFQENRLAEIPMKVPEIPPHGHKLVLCFIFS